MDRWSARLANRLAGNPDASPVLEITLLGPRLRFDRPSRVAVTGAAFNVDLDGRLVRSPFVEHVQTGAVVSFGDRLAGARAYLAVDGSFHLTPVLGSVSAHVRAPFGGLAGRALRAGDDLTLGGPRADASGTLGDDAFGSWWAASDGESGRVLRVLATSGPGWSISATETLCAAPFVVSTRSDRMGYRLEGQASWDRLPGSLLSGPTTVGGVQVPPGGEPILLMADHQTTGGYAQVAVLCRADRQVAGQLAPGDRVRFRAITFEEAQAAHVARERALARLAPEVHL
jgi:antagonist of KipI